MKKKEIEKSIEEFLLSFDEKAISESSIKDLIENIKIFKKELEFQNDELKRVNSELENKSNFIENLFKIIPSPVLLAQTNFKIIKYNQAFKDIFGNYNKIYDDFRRLFSVKSQENLYFLLNKSNTRAILTGIDGKSYLVDVSEVTSANKKYILLHLTDITEVEQTKLKLQIENDIRNLLSSLLDIQKSRDAHIPTFEIIKQKLVDGLLNILSADIIHLVTIEDAEEQSKRTRSYTSINSDIDDTHSSQIIRDLDTVILSEGAESVEKIPFATLYPYLWQSGVEIQRINLSEKNFLKGNIIIITKQKIDEYILEFLQDTISNFLFKIFSEIKLFESEQRLNALITNSPYGLVIIENNQIIYASDNYFKITNVPRHDPRWQNVSQIFNYIHPDDRSFVQEKLKTAVQEKKDRIIYEFRILDVNGNYVWQQDAVSIVYRDDGTYRLYIIARNYNEQKLQLQYLKTLEEAINQSSASIVITDVEGNIQYINKAFSDITGYKAEEVLQKNPRILKSGKVPKEIYEDLWSTLLGGKSWHGELVNKKKDGTLYTEHATISPVIIDGKIINFVAVKNDITKYKELLSRHETLSLVASHTQNIVIITDNKGYITWVNKSFENKTGYSFDEVLGKKPGSFLQGKDTNQAHVFLIRKKLNELVPFKQEILNYTKSGEPYWIEMNITPIFDENGNHTMYIAVEDDITIRKEFEKKIIESERKNRAILSALPDLLFVIDKDFRYVDFHVYDPSQILMAPEKFLGKTIMEIMPKEQGNIIIENIKSTFKTAEFREFHFHLDIGGKRKYYEGRCVLKDLHSVLILIRDVTKTKKYEQELKNEKLLFKTVIDNLPNTIYVKDKNFKKILVNKAEIFYLGKTSEEEVLGKDDKEFYSEEVFNGIMKEDKEVIAGKPLINKIVEYTNNYGEKKYMMISKLPFRDFDGQIAGIIGIGVDITDLKNKENELQKTIQVITDQNQRLRSFTYIVSHNIRSYAANIDGLIELLNSDYVAEEEIPDLLKLLQSASENLMETITALNEVITIEKAVHERIEQVEVKKILVKVLDIVKKDIQKYSIEIENNIPESAKITHIPAYLESILLNLTTNAIKYRNRNLKSKIKYSFIEKSGKKILEVSDNGLGIDMEKYGKKIFTMFETFHGNPDAKGIGLFITKAQVEALGGKIEVESKVNEGSTFRIIFKD